MAVINTPPQLEDDSKERVSLLIRHRLPWLFLGLLGGIGAIFLSAQFESLLEEKIHLAFFIPIIVYLADAVGTQTEVVYVRNIGKKGVTFASYLVKEIILGLFIGALFGAIVGAVSYLWFHDIASAVTVGLSMFVTILMAPVFALIVVTFLKKEHTDPAVTAAPFYTVLQDITTLAIYFLIASLIIFN